MMARQIRAAWARVLAAVIERDWPRAGLIKRARGKGCDLLGLSGTFCL